MGFTPNNKIIFSQLLLFLWSLQLPQNLISTLMTKSSIILNIMSIMKILIKILFYKMIMKMNIDLRRILGENNKSTLNICMLKIIKIRKIILKIIKWKRFKMLYKRKDI